MAVILPKAHVTNWRGPLFFLAGPVRGGGDWQYRAYELLKDEYGDDFTAVIPMRYPLTHPIHKEALPADPDAPVFGRQMAWERHYLARAGRRSLGSAGCLLFWLLGESLSDPHPGPEPFAMDTRRELGEWYTRLEYEADGIRLVVGAEQGIYGENFHGFNQFKRCLDESNGSPFPIYDTIVATVRAAIERAI